MNLENTVKKASQILKKNNIYSPELDAQIILSNIMNVTREFLISNNYINISEEIIQKYNDLEITAISELAVNTCSLIVTLAMIKRKISVSEASSLVFLEESHQIHRSTEEININKQQDAVQQELTEALEFFFLVSK